MHLIVQNRSQKSHSSVHSVARYLAANLMSNSIKYECPNFNTIVISMY